MPAHFNISFAVLYKPGFTHHSAVLGQTQAGCCYSTSCRGPATFLWDAGLEQPICPGTAALAVADSGKEPCGYLGREELREITPTAKSPSCRQPGAVCGAVLICRVRGSCLTPQTLLSRSTSWQRCGFLTLVRCPGVESADLPAFPWLSFYSQKLAGLFQTCADLCAKQLSPNLSSTCPQSQFAAPREAVPATGQLFKAARSPARRWPGTWPPPFLFTPR